MRSIFPSKKSTALTYVVIKKIDHAPSLSVIPLWLSRPLPFSKRASVEIETSVRPHPSAGKGCAPNNNNGRGEHEAKGQER